jgi:hypothetical protein
VSTLVSTSYTLIITLQRKKSPKTTATRPVSKIEQWETAMSTFSNKESVRVIRMRKTIAVNKIVVVRKAPKVIITGSIN